MRKSAGFMAIQSPMPRITVARMSASTSRKRAEKMPCQTAWMLASRLCAWLWHLSSVRWKLAMRSCRCVPSLVLAQTSQHAVLAAHDVLSLSHLGHLMTWRTHTTAGWPLAERALIHKSMDAPAQAARQSADTVH